MVEVVVVRENLKRQLQAQMSIQYVLLVTPTTSNAQRTDSNDYRIKDLHSTC